jgi:hypothetical protein
VTVMSRDVPHETIVAEIITALADKFAASTGEARP